MKAQHLDIIWFKSYDPGRGLRKYQGTLNHLANITGNPTCKVRPAYAAERLQISGNLPNNPTIPVDCKKCQLIMSRAQ